ncbi:pantoate-beta-alanine ligase [Halalkalibacter wakoensis JCM 9140]|uniref:Pantothenate synthetase n=1 Tax=Halalkalibacter wakoensis JCM 9140 TaxID=1236970 RepID=W4PYZ2_9BACI|nr:pantoate--beta-alanine ligase [Halalkalibacter wakoensis]GAE25046.1 pantoate-beta-alanine ligase [Halalkalibacter wakoensis JCM 9140]
MKVVERIKEIRNELNHVRKSGTTIGFVPTMGYLHEGHVSLIHAAKKKKHFVVVSIFVNPLQFGPNEDLDRYPRDFERDEKIAKEAGADLVFYPSVHEMYPTNMPMTIHVTNGADVLCGKSRPGHFDGVATVVMKLLQIVQPTEAFFGQKDAQQLAIIMNMVQAFNVPISITGCPTIREEDGLAKSSRNVYLEENEREEAPFLYETLRKGAEWIQLGETSRSAILAELKKSLEKGSGTLDYVDVLTYPSLEPVENLQGKVILAVAYAYKKARLIDNYILELKEEA